MRWTTDNRDVYRDIKRTSAMTGPHRRPRTWSWSARVLLVIYVAIPILIWADII